uniref:NEDD8-activating enzyme E1 regulatory subunit n=1 Tax=Spongospora subterranea TaxID=70186 RepID=A0A0H5R8A9_9EUKA|eukprot:CRZ10368.1 hypothetical protein [Spongospora subterranea]
MDRSHHENKFDRQIRLWGFHGQATLESAHVLVLGSGPIASEFIKNLILANVAEFTIMDDSTVSLYDVGNNFFISSSSVGKDRGAVVASLLSELNLDCAVKHIDRNPAEFIKSCGDGLCHSNEDYKSLCQYTIVVATGIHLVDASLLCDILFPLKIPLLHIRSFGLIASLRLAISEHAVIETHPENESGDLFLHPSQLIHFPKLSQLLLSFDLFGSNTDEFVFTHVPFPAILLQLSNKFALEKPNVVCTPEEFKSFISSHNRLNSSNFDEAIRFTHYRTRDPRHHISGDLRDILSDSKASLTSSEADPFWILVKALKLFLSNEGHGFLPVSASLPDMTADTDSYLALKLAYSEKALADRQSVGKYVKDILLAMNLRSDHVPDLMIDEFVKNCRSIHVSRMRGISYDVGTFCDETAKAVVCEALAEEVDSLDQDQDSAICIDQDSNRPPNDIHWYLAIKCADIFHQKHGYYPGDRGDSIINSDLQALTEIASTVFKCIGFDPDNINTSCLEEIVRFGSSSIHNTASLIAGIAAQESLKLITRQYVVFNNTVVWNGVHATLARWSL